MIAVPSLRIVLATRPVDFRRGHDALAATAAGGAGSRYLFRGDRDLPLAPRGQAQAAHLGRHRPGDDLQASLSRAASPGPGSEDGVMRLTKGQFEALFEGLDWRRVKPRAVRRPLAAE